MFVVIAFLMLAQAWTAGSLTWLMPGNYDTTVLQIDGTNYQVAFGSGCEDFSPPMGVFVLAGSGGVALLSDADGFGECNVLIGVPVS